MNGKPKRTSKLFSLSLSRSGDNNGSYYYTQRKSYLWQCHENLQLNYFTLCCCALFIMCVMYMCLEIHIKVCSLLTIQSGCCMSCYETAPSSEQNHQTTDSQIELKREKKQRKKTRSKPACERVGVWESLPNCFAWKKRKRNAYQNEITKR